MRIRSRTHACVEASATRAQRTRECTEDGALTIALSASLPLQHFWLTTQRALLSLSLVLGPFPDSPILPRFLCLSSSTRFLSLASALVGVPSRQEFENAAADALQTYTDDDDTTRFHSQEAHDGITFNEHAEDAARMQEHFTQEVSS